MRRFYQGRDLSRVHTIEELAWIAKRCLPYFAWEYLAGGAEAELTLADNRRDFDRLGLLPRTLRGIDAPALETRLFGQATAMPMAIAPTGYNAMLYRNADIHLARAATEAGIPFCMSTVSTSSMEEVVAHVPGVNLWFQLYCLNDPAIQEDLLKRAQSLQVSTLLLTSDAVTLGNREWDKRNFIRPRQLSLRNKLDVLRHPAWIRRALWPSGMPSLGNLNPYLPPHARTAAGAAHFIGQAMDATLDWNALAKLRDRWPGNLVLKGVLHPGDAERALALGLDGIVVTNHGGRQLDGSPSSIRALAGIRSAVKGKMQILFDSGVRRGTDVAKALALGADAVLVGRPTLYGVAAAGQQGAAKALCILAEELKRTMILLGSSRLDELNEDQLFDRMGAFYGTEPPVAAIDKRPCEWPIMQ
ncbi:alpha-hydroxy acid oxidase [Pseudomonas typographi]|uniref:alpha-hydroxy acid oxidase n=1 Tax=Pseudomonas typographi TaxID=2715964 RepID=UPI00168886A6|nr:alpha-hydroxy acid oxidase [Pseudomonas typographi]MBD1550218.1 alpha-hydroxy-acid oxidizing protein [Pseudomonas typographi]MBD1586022.1 alpha-hydroxy-acid oxidizing protein [Pseudomonas typographi]